MPEYLAPGVYVEEVSFRPKSIEGVSTSTTAFVGPTRKGPLSETPEVITSFGEFARVYGGLANLSFSEGGDAEPPVTNYMAHAVRSFFDNGGSRLYVGRTFIPRDTSDGIARSAPFVDSSGDQARIVARVPGAGLNGVVRAFEKRTPATAVTMQAAPEGSMLRLGGDEAAQPAVLEGGTPPFTLNHGDQLVLTVGGADTTITFEGTPAEATGSALTGPIDTTDATLDITVGGLAQSIPLPDGSTGLADLVSAINVGLRHGYARLEGGDQLVIGSDVRGEDAEVTVSANALLGFASDVTAPGSGNVGNIAAVTMADIADLLPDTVQATQSPTTGLMVISTVATGESATLAASGTARDALGLPEDAETGSDGVEPEYYVKNGASWVDQADAALGTLSTPAELVTMNLEVEDADGSTILYEDLGFAPTHPRYIGQVLQENPTSRANALQNPYYLEIAAGITPFQLQAGLFGTQAENTILLQSGNDGVEPTMASVVDDAVSYENALELLEDIEDISIIAAPGHSAFADYPAVRLGLISHAERMRYRIAVLDPPSGQTLAEVRETRSFVDSTYAALYYPWVMVSNPLARPGNERIPKEIPLPPSGFVTGIYARNDIQRGVWKAPANEVVRGALRFEREVNHRQQEVLNPEGINCLRYFFGRGNRVWGARTVSSDPEWKYVNVRRYFIYLERSIDRSTQWVVFEPNGERLWANVRETVSAFLYNEWRNGALLGTKPEEAYFVRCDRSTMTQNDLDNGRLICEVGVAVLKPAEFVIFRIGQKTADARS